MGQAMVYATYPDLADKRVLITGGGTGIGAGIVDAFVSRARRCSSSISRRSVETTG
jgi:NAD(P)-dependent dehydrogenase (short-subunit alcohol dehydrogenase family)